MTHEVELGRLREGDEFTRLKKYKVEDDAHIHPDERDVYVGDKHMAWFFAKTTVVSVDDATYQRIKERENNASS